jgi:hypothetical protein
MLEIDANAVTVGTAYQQCFVASACSSGAPAMSALGAALGLTGEGNFYKDPAAFQQNAVGQLTLNSTSISGGNLDINNFNAVFPADPVGTTGSSVGTSSTGRGTMALAATNPTATYNLIYYLIDDNSALLLDKDATLVLRGALARQF